jgi:pSer/pThr/pTyr-binding forkhead associated (FHA) protein
VLWEGRAYPLQPDTLVVGRESTTNPRHITLPDGLAGVSRRHCTFVHDGDELVLLDHSSFGTFVNGERVQERVRIYAGDRVKLGEPGIELTLIAVGTQQP